MSNNPNRRTDCYGTELPPISESDGALYARASLPPPNIIAPGAQLERFGITWRDDHSPIAVPMPNGYWTPWHLAAAALAVAQQRIATLESQLSAITLERDALKRPIDGPAPDVQEAVLQKLGVREKLAAAEQRIAELETLNTERNRQNAAAFAEVDRLGRATHALQHIASFWKDRPSGGYAASVLEDMNMLPGVSGGAG